jgi:hypothetical protein
MCKTRTMNKQQNMNMKIKTALSALAVGILAVAGTSQRANATPLTGEIVLGGIGSVNNEGPAPGDSLAASTIYTSSALLYEGGTDSFGPPNIVSATASMQPLQFAGPPTPPVGALWTVTVSVGTGGPTYTFDATSLKSTYTPSENSWTISGSGTIYENGVNPTPASYQASLGVTGGILIEFGSTTAAGVPDGGMTVALLGGALVAVQGLRRKLNS